MYAREKFGAVGPAQQSANWLQGPWVEARGSSARWTRRLFVRARFQPCRKYRNIRAALAAEVLWFSLSHRVLSPAKERRGAGRRRSRRFARAKALLPRGAKKPAAHSAPFSRGRCPFDLSSHSSLDTSHLRLFTSRGAENALAFGGAKFRGPRRAPARWGGRSIHVRVETRLTSNRINNLIFADRYTFVSAPESSCASQKFAAVKECGRARVYNAGAASLFTLSVGVRKNGRGFPISLLRRIR